MGTPEKPDTCQAIKKWDDERCMKKCGDSRKKCFKKCTKYCNAACGCNICHDDASWKVTKPKRYKGRGGCSWVAQDFQRCRTVKGKSGRGGKVMKASNACKMSCGKCPLKDKRRLTIV